eukprot:15275124-Ditylum_brightwellii.AAC.1
MEELKADISRCSRKALMNFDNDAALCYNWIIPNLANLIGACSTQIRCDTSTTCHIWPHF